MDEEALLYQIALTRVSGIGDVLGKKLVRHCGSAQAVFREKRKFIQRIPRVGRHLYNALDDPEAMTFAEKELRFIKKHRIRPLFFMDPGYPVRLKNCLDSPVLMYFKGNADLNARRVIAIVGTRRATDYGREVCHDLVAGLSGPDTLIVSGLAYGIDGCAHRASLEQNMTTIAVLGHGLDRIYPETHRSLAEKMINQGGLLTDFPSGTIPDRENFPSRNRIIAGLCDAVVVVEAAGKGGALITAEIANSYNRDVFAVPGRITDQYSEGTNRLIRTNKAALVQSAQDIRYMMGWDPDNIARPPVQRKLFIELTGNEKKIVDILQNKGETGIDDLCIEAGLKMSVVSAALLNLEFEGIVKSIPGKVYAMV
ncbi:MAG: DNA-processing protein DprA [Bacteroidota bacterium]|nr:DNA-processing protein DprA [Bacteroidota bacterium]